MDEDKMVTKIREHFRANNLPKPGAINLIGPWARGTCYAVTCGLIRLRRFCVYCIGEEIHSVRQR